MMNDPELDALLKISEALSGLEGDVRARVLAWALSRYGNSQSALPSNSNSSSILQDNMSPRVEAADSKDLPTMFNVANPATALEKVLAVSYWFQVTQGHEDYESHIIHKELKQMGHKMSNITDVFSRLIRSKPALAMQVRKSGTSRQARKKYKLTTSGIEKVKRMLRGASQETPEE